MEEQSQRSTQEIEDYIAKGIKTYKWTDDFIVKDLGRQGFSKEEAHSLIAKVKKERHVNNKSFFEDEGDENKPSGLFELILIAIVFVGALSFVFGHTFLGRTGIIIGAFWFLFSIYAVVQVHRKKPNAIFLLKSFLLAYFIYKTLELILRFIAIGDMEFSLMGIIYNMSYLACCVAFYLYLCRSEHVQKLFPKEKRKAFVWDKILAAMFYILPILLMLVAILTTPKPNNTKDAGLIQMEKFKEDQNRMKDRLFDYVERTGHNQNNTSRILYDKNANILSLSMQLPIKEQYLNNPKCLDAVNKLGDFLSLSSLGVMAKEEVENGYDSLAYYISKVTKDVQFTVQLPDEQVILSKKISLDNNDVKKYRFEMASFSVFVTNSISRNNSFSLGNSNYDKEAQTIHYVLNMDESVWDTSKMGSLSIKGDIEFEEKVAFAHSELKSINYDKGKRTLKYFLPINEIKWGLSQKEFLSLIEKGYLDLVTEYKNSISFRSSLKKLNVSMQFVLLGSHDNVIYQKIFSPKEL